MSFSAYNPFNVLPSYRTPNITKTLLDRFKLPYSSTVHFSHRQQAYKLRKSVTTIFTKKLICNPPPLLECNFCQYILSVPFPFLQRQKPLKHFKNYCSPHCGFTTSILPIQIKSQLISSHFMSLNPEWKLHDMSCEILLLEAIALEASSFSLAKDILSTQYMNS